MRFFIKLNVFMFIVFISLNGYSEEEKNIKIYFSVYRVNGDIEGRGLSLTDDIYSGIDSPNAEQKKCFNFFTKTIPTSSIADTTLEADFSSWKWNGETKPPKNSNVQQLGSPMVVTSPGYTAEIQVSSVMQYFNKRPDGLYELKNSEEPAGISIIVTPEKGPNDRILLKDMTIMVRTVKEREKISGVDLDVGPPVFNVAKGDISINIKPDQYYGAVFKSNGQGVFLIRIRAELLNQ